MKGWSKEKYTYKKYKRKEKQHEMHILYMKRIEETVMKKTCEVGESRRKSRRKWKGGKEKVER